MNFKNIEGMKILTSWNKSVLCQNFNTVDSTNCGDYNSIGLFDVVYKILATDIRTKLQKRTEEGRYYNYNQVQTTLFYFQTWMPLLQITD